MLINNLYNNIKYISFPATDQKFDGRLEGFLCMLLECTLYENSVYFMRIFTIVTTFVFFLNTKNTTTGQNYYD